MGVKEGLMKEQVRKALLAQDYDAIMPRLPIQAGDTVYVPGGVLHSFGPNTLIYEIEQTSNIQQTAMLHRMEDGQKISQEEWHQNIEALLNELQLKPLPVPQPSLVVMEGRNIRLLLRRPLFCSGADDPCYAQPTVVFQRAHPIQHRRTH